MSNLILDEMSWKQVRERLPRIKLAIIPTGSSEQHGPHLPMQVDTICAVQVSTRLGESLYPEALVVTPVPFGVSYHHMGFPGTLTLKEETIIGIVYDICWSLKQHGISNILIVNGHKGNTNALSVATRRITDEIGAKCIAVEYWNFVTKAARDSVGDGVVPGHGSEFETSIYLSSNRSLIGGKYKRTFKPDEAYKEMYLRPRTYLSMKKLFESSPDGLTLGNPAEATAEEGKKLVNSAAEELLVFVKREFEI